MNCPKCLSDELQKQMVENIQVDCCRTCHGIWLDALELEKLLAADPRPLLGQDRHFTKAEGGQDSRLNCPRCKGVYLIKLNSRIRPGTILDSCTVCFGNWLDAGELTRLAHKDLVGQLRRLFT